MTRLTIPAAGLALALAATPALAGREPTPEERVEVEAALQQLGFVAWDEIEWDDDGYWEVDDARGQDGVQFDLHLAPETFEVLKQERD